MTPLWQRRIIDSNFLELNLGVGYVPMKINIHYPEEHFSMIDDNLKNIVNELGKEPKILPMVPIVYSFYKNKISSIVGEFNQIHEYTKQIIVQLLTHHSYDDLKLIILTDGQNQHICNFLKTIPHVFSNDKKIRFFATNDHELKEVCYYVDTTFNTRTDF